jgi:hypothetical protein
MASFFGGKKDTGDVEFWHNPERNGWLMKQGRRWYLAKLLTV